MTESRVEDKYIVYADQIAYLKTRLKDIMEIDSHSRNGSYLIRSVYFDDMYDTALSENLAGVDERIKVRIRSYNNDGSFIRLEEKSKHNGYTRKNAVRVSGDVVRGLLSKPSMQEAPVASLFLKGEKKILCKRLYANMNLRLMHPVTIVEYERYAFTEKAGNVRITFDENIGASSEVGRFFEKDIHAIPTMETGAHVMEVKYDELLPDYIKQIIDTGSLQRCAFSKYTYARMIKDEIGEIL